MKKTLLGYVPTKSVAYQFHPFTRLYFVFVLTFLPLFILSPVYNISIIFLVFLLFLVSNINISVLKKYLPLFLILLIFILLIYTFFPEDTMKKNYLFAIFKLKFYKNALYYGLKVYLRIISILFLTIYFLHTNSESDIIIALRSIRIPFIICYTIGLALRTIGMFIEDYRIIREAEKARAINFKEMNIFQKIPKMLAYIIPLLSLGIRRTEEFSDAIAVRGFSFKNLYKRPNFLGTKYKFRFYDFIVNILISCIVIFILVNYK